MEDYLARFPVGEDDLIHVEDGSWSGGVTLMQERNIKKTYLQKIIQVPTMEIPSF